MVGRNVRLDHAGMAALAKSADMQKLCREAADRIAGHLRAEGIRVGDRDGGPRETELPITVTDSVTDRAHATVAITHPSGVAVQAKHGALTRAASAEGLRVR